MKAFVKLVESFPEVPPHLTQVTLTKLPAAGSQVGTTECGLEGEAVPYSRPPGDHTTSGLLVLLNCKLTAGQRELGGGLLRQQEGQQPVIQEVGVVSIRGAAAIHEHVMFAAVSMEVDVHAHLSLLEELLYHLLSVVDGRKESLVGCLVHSVQVHTSQGGAVVANDDTIRV
jgi:hypothetical protein